MDPSYNNGGISGAGGTANTPGVKPGVIASGPEPASAPSATVPNASTPGTGITPGVIASGPESEVEPRPIDTPAGLNMNSSRMPSGGRPMNMPVNNDIVLNGGGGPKKMNKGLLIGGIVAVVVLAIVAVVVGVIVGSRGNNTSNDTTINLTSFNRLINYVTSGTESTSSVEYEYISSKNYYLLSGWNDNDEKDDIYIKTKNLMDVFVSGYVDGDNEVLNNLVKTIKEQFDFIYAIKTIDRITNLEAIMVGVENSREKAEKILMGHYDLSYLGENTYADGFLRDYSEWVKNILDEVKIYKENDCISSGLVDNSCINSKANQVLLDELADISNNINILYMSVTNYYNVPRKYIANIYDINDIFYGRLTMDEEDE